MDGNNQQCTKQYPDGSTKLYNTKLWKLKRDDYRRYEQLKSSN